MLGLDPEDDDQYHFHRLIPFIRTSDTALEFVLLAQSKSTPSSFEIFLRTTSGNFPFGSTICSANCLYCAKNSPNYCFSCRDKPPTAFFSAGRCEASCDKSYTLRLSNMMVAAAHSGNLRVLPQQLFRLHQLRQEVQQTVLRLLRTRTPQAATVHFRLPGLQRRQPQGRARGVRLQERSRRGGGQVLAQVQVRLAYQTADQLRRLVGRTVVPLHQDVSLQLDHHQALPRRASPHTR